MAALRTQNKLAMAAWQGMHDSYAPTRKWPRCVHNSPRSCAAHCRRMSRHPRRRWMRSWLRSAAPRGAVDVAVAVEAVAAARAAAQPGGVTPFNAINGMYNTVLASLAQDGIDMPPSKAEIDTWESGCKANTATVNAWKTMLDESLFTFNSQLTKNNLTPLKVTPTALSAPASCTFVWPSGGK